MIRHIFSLRTQCYAGYDFVVIVFGSDTCATPKSNLGTNWEINLNLSFGLGPVLIFFHYAFDFLTSLHTLML